MKYEEWNNLRARLHHDWLQNRYLTFLKSWKECFDDIKACSSNSEDILEQLLQWKKKREAFQTLINDCEAALSPRQLLYEPPLNSMSEENKEWLGEVIHALYCARTGIKDKILRLQSMLTEADKCVDMAAKRLRGENGIKDFTGDMLILVFIDFSKAISGLPHEIQVV